MKNKFIKLTTASGNAYIVRADLIQEVRTEENGSSWIKYENRDWEMNVKESVIEIWEMLK